MTKNTTGWVKMNDPMLHRSKKQPIPCLSKRPKIETQENLSTECDKPPTKETGE